MQISATKVIDLINLVYTLNLITNQSPQSWGSLQEPRGATLPLPGEGFAAPGESFLGGALGLPLGP